MKFFIVLTYVHFLNSGFDLVAYVYMYVCVHTLSHLLGNFCVST